MIHEYSLLVQRYCEKWISAILEERIEFLAKLCQRYRVGEYQKYLEIISTFWYCYS